MATGHLPAGTPALKQEAKPLSKPVDPAKEQTLAFEKATAMFHKRDFARARDLFAEAAGGPGVELAHSALMYKNMCERRLGGGPAQAKSPEELSLEEIELLRTRLAESSELREALFGQMQMEGYLATALGRINLSPHEIMARADRAQGRFQLTVPLVCILLAVPLFLLLGAALWNAVAGKQAEVAAGTKTGERTEKEKVPKDKGENSRSGNHDQDQGEQAKDNSKPQGDSANSPATKAGNATPTAPHIAPTPPVAIEPWQDSAP